MKYFITSTFEIDGHGSAGAILCNGEAAKKQYLHEVLYDQETESYYPTRTVHHESDGSTTLYGEWTCGYWSINILPFKTFKEITNKERYAQTG